MSDEAEIWPDMLTFLEHAGAGCISGRVADWPQLKPACKWAAEEIKRYIAAQPAATGEGEWKPIDTAPADGQFLAFGSYIYQAGQAPTIYYRVAERSDDQKWPFEDDEGKHPDGFFSHWMPLPVAPISLEPSAPPSPPAEVAGERCCLCDSPMKDGSCTGDPNGCVMVVSPSPPQPAPEKSPVITGPGKYVGTYEGKQRVSKIVGQCEGGTWVGVDADGDVEGWLENGDAVQYPTFNCITGPYVEPPEPVLTITPMRQEYGWVYAWCEYKGDLRPGEGKGPIHVLLYDDQPGYVPVDGHLAFVSGGPFVCREKHWPRVQELVAQVNAGKAVGT